MNEIEEWNSCADYKQKGNSSGTPLATLLFFFLLPWHFHSTLKGSRKIVYRSLPTSNKGKMKASKILLSYGRGIGIR